MSDNKMLVDIIPFNQNDLINCYGAITVMMEEGKKAKADTEPEDSREAYVFASLAMTQQKIEASLIRAGGETMRALLELIREVGTDGIL